MKRDMELIRKILIYLEENKNPEKWEPINIEGYDTQTVSYHLKILTQAELIEAKDVGSKTNVGLWWAKSLQWDGHEFLDAIKNDTVWSQIQEKTKNESSEMPFKILVGVSLELAKQYFKDKIGL